MTASLQASFAYGPRFLIPTMHVPPFQYTQPVAGKVSLLENGGSVRSSAHAACLRPRD